MTDEVVEGHDIQVIEQATEPELKRPSMYKVYLMNDDFTPMDFVVEVLEGFFAMSREKAVTTMLQIHHSGKAICGVYTRDIAETKVVQVNDYAESSEHPLLCDMEAEG